MNREILFRGKRTDNGEWVEGYLVKQYGANEIYLPNGTDNEGFDRYSVDISTIGQYTGLNDCDDVKIFEGDIVRLDNRSPEGSWTAVVEFGNPNGTYSWGYQLKRIDGDEGFNPDILLWIEMEETGQLAKSSVTSTMIPI